MGNYSKAEIEQFHKWFFGLIENLLQKRHSRKRLSRRTIVLGVTFERIQLWEKQFKDGIRDTLPDGKKFKDFCISDDFKFLDKADQLKLLRKWIDVGMHETSPTSAELTNFVLVLLNEADDNFVESSFKRSRS